MRNLILIAIIAFVLSSCASSNYSNCPAYGGWTSGCGGRQNMKKLTLSVAALSIAMMSYSQTQCKELTKDSIQCKNNTKAKNSLCYLHNPFYTNKTKTPTVLCSGITKKNNNCKNKTKNTSGLCHLHNKKD